MINKQQVMCLIGVVIVCTAVAWWHGYKQLEQNTIERRVSWRTAEQWMLQSLPGLGPKKSQQIHQQLANDEEIKWPKRAQPYLNEVFLDYASASRNASHER